VIAYKDDKLMPCYMILCKVKDFNIHLDTSTNKMF